MCARLPTDACYMCIGSLTASSGNNPAAISGAARRARDRHGPGWQRVSARVTLLVEASTRRSREPKK